MPRFIWNCPITLEATTRPIYVLKCGHSVSDAILHDNTSEETILPTYLQETDVANEVPSTDPMPSTSEETDAASEVPSIDPVPSTPVQCPICRADGGVHLIRNFALEEKTCASEETDVASEELMLHNSRLKYDLETTQVKVAIAESRYTIAMQDVATLRAANQGLKRKHEDLAFDVAYNSTSLRDWRSSRIRSSRTRSSRTNT